FATELFAGAGLAPELALDVADILLEADLLGHTTHGLALAASYLREVESGRMTRKGEPEIVARRPAVQTWEGRLLPGPWLTLRALDTATEMARTYGTGIVVVRRSHHIACLAAYLERYTAQGLFVVLASSNPYAAFVPPHGGTRAVMTPNPVAAGLPTSGDPILVDVSMSS